MPDLESIKRFAGSWSGPSSLWFEPDTPAFESVSTAVLGTVGGGKVVTFDYTWAHEGAPQDGRILLAVRPTGVHMAWCDSFHTDSDIMDLVGDGSADVVAASGTYSVPGPEVWGWRIELDTRTPDSLLLRMYNILPASMGGLEALAVLTEYTRA